MFKPVVVIGGGGHAAVLVDMLQQLKVPIAAVVCPKLDDSRTIFKGIKHLLSDDDVLSYDPTEIVLVNGIGFMPNNHLRIKIFNRFKTLGYHFFTVISPHSVVSSTAELGEGVQVMANAVLQTGAFVGDDSIINSASTVEHDCIIGKHNHLAPGSVVCGDVETEDCVHIGAGATVIQSLLIGKYSIVGAGACVTKDIAQFHTVYPAQTFIKNNNENVI